MAFVIKFLEMVDLDGLMDDAGIAGWGASRPRIAQIMHLPNVHRRSRSSSCSG